MNYLDWVSHLYGTYYFRKNSFFLVYCVTTDKFWFWKKFCWWEVSTGLYTFCELWSLFNILVVGCRKYKLIKLCFHLKISHYIPVSHFSWFAANKRLYWSQWKWKVLMSFTQLFSASVKPNHKKIYMQKFYWKNNLNPTLMQLIGSLQCTEY